MIIIEDLTVNESVSDGCLTPNEQFSAISWREQVTFNEMMMMSVLYQINTCAPGELAVPAPHVVPVVLLSLQTRCKS